MSRRHNDVMSRRDVMWRHDVPSWHDMTLYVITKWICTSQPIRNSETLDGQSRLPALQSLPNVKTSYDVMVWRHDDKTWHYTGYMSCAWQSVQIYMLSWRDIMTSFDVFGKENWRGGHDAAGCVNAHNIMMGPGEIEGGLEMFNFVDGPLSCYGQILIELSYSLASRISNFTVWSCFTDEISCVTFYQITSRILHTHTPDCET